MAKADQWKNEYCDTCWYCVDKFCRRFPPTKMKHQIGFGQYPIVCMPFGDEPCIRKACAEWSTE